MPGLGLASIPLSFRPVAPHRPVRFVPPIPRVPPSRRALPDRAAPRPLGERLRAAGAAIRRFTFPPRVEPAPDLSALLAAVYPRLDLRRVSFHAGMPHLLSLLPYQAITLPATFGLRRVRIYIRGRRWRLDRVDGLGLVVHEAFHALQIQEGLGGWGVGLLRPFPVLYLACAAANGFLYRGHPVETDAYALAGQRASRFERTLRDRGGRGTLSREAIAAAVAELAVERSGLAFWRKVWASVPGLPPLGQAIHALARRPAGWRVVLAPLGWLAAAPLALLGAAAVAVWLALWTAAAAILWVAQMLVEGLGAACAGSLAGLGALLSLGSDKAPRERAPGAR